MVKKIQNAEVTCRILLIDGNMGCKKLHPRQTRRVLLQTPTFLWPIYDSDLFLMILHILPLESQAYKVEYNSKTE